MNPFKKFVRWAAIQLGDVVLEGTVAERDALAVQLKKATDVINGLNDAIGVARDKLVTNHNNAVTTIGALVVVGGGSVSITRDTLKALETGPINIDYVWDEHALTLKLLSDEEVAAREAAEHAELENDAEFEDDLDECPINDGTCPGCDRHD